MAKRRRIRWDRVLIVFGPIFLLILLIHVGCRHRGETESSEPDALTSVDSMELTESSETSEAVPAQAPFRDLIVVVDPCHGGKDSGATTKDESRLEKDDNLRLGLAVAEKLRSYPHIQVIMTRDTDVFVGLQERCDIANNANADYFISLHRNVSKNGKGVEIWINNDYTPMEKLLAEYIMEWLEKAGISDNRGTQTGFRNNNGVDDYMVNSHTNMPSCLIEMGFMNSLEDNRNFDDKLDQYADAISGALIELVTDKGIYTQDGVQ